MRIINHRKQLFHFFVKAQKQCNTTPSVSAQQPQANSMDAGSPLIVHPIGKANEMSAMMQSNVYWLLSFFDILPEHLQTSENGKVLSFSS